VWVLDCLKSYCGLRHSGNDEKLACVKKEIELRKVILFNLMTLDGFFEGPNREIDWHNVDDEFSEFEHEQHSAADLLLFGRVTYELMAGFWPTPEARSADPITADFMNSIPKIVFSNTLKTADWNNTRLVKGDPGEEIKNLKKQPGKAMFIFGSSDLIPALMRQGLMDEVWIMLNPIILGSGKPHFHDFDARIKFKLLKTRAFQNGNVLLCYQPLVN
jgi:dihydrofolate reductase